jgi:hypothetical protein
MTFDDRAKRRWRVATACAIVGFVVMLILCALFMVFTVFVAVPLDTSGVKIVLAVVLFLSAVSFGIGWGFRGIYVTTIDTIIRDMGLLQRKVLMAAIEEETKEGR